MEKNVHSELITIDNSINKVKKWIEENEYKGNEPFDGLSSKLRFLTFKNLLLERILQQLVRQSPFNLRPFLGIKPLDSTKGRGYAAQSYMYNWDINGNNSDKEKAINCLEWLTENNRFRILHKLCDVISAINS
jgi:hypothetical protein